jgi:hypothetical protein
MASAIEKGGKNPTGAVASYFVSGEEAQHAIDALLDEGFNVSEIGAAFHSRAQRVSLRAVEEEPLRRTSGSDVSFGGAASGTGGVTPSGLSTGGGTGISGAHRPGPIPGSEIPPGLPTNIRSELPTDAEVETFSERKATGKKPGATQEMQGAEDKKSWRDRLETVFGRGSAGEQGPAKGNQGQKFGAGEGHLGEIVDYPYSSLAFEQSFTSMGIPPEHARRLAQELQRGGAVVTVKAGSKGAAAEAIFQRHHGIIRYESEPALREVMGGRGDVNYRMEIFGEVRRVYPGYAQAEKQSQRKAS